MYEYNINKFEERKRKNGVKKCLYLTQEAVKILEYGAGATRCSLSAFADQIICSWYDKTDPMKEFKALEIQESELEVKRNEVRQRKLVVLERIEHHKEFKELRESKKGEAIRILIRKFTEGADPFEIENIARHWSNRLGRFN